MLDILELLRRWAVAWFSGKPVRTWKPEAIRSIRRRVVCQGCDGRGGSCAGCRGEGTRVYRDREYGK
jgi:hypothetical protein